jgi:hypothetical protein
MTETNAPAAATEFSVCSDCAIVIANGDTSGIEDAEAHLAAMDEALAGCRHVVIICSGEDCARGGFRTDTCGACGTCTATDGWHCAVAELIEEN